VLAIVAKPLIPHMPDNVGRIEYRGAGPHSRAVTMDVPLGISTDVDNYSGSMLGLPRNKLESKTLCTMSVIPQKRMGVAKRFCRGNKS